MQNLNKKGMSSIIQVSFLITLSIVALSLVWGYVSDLSSDFENQLSPTVDCISQDSKITSACVNNEGKVQLNVDVGLEEDIYNLDINYLGESFSCDQTCGSCNLKDEQGRKTVYLETINPVNSQDKIAIAINKCLPEVLTITSC